jgi:hypothetical protein
MDVQLPAALVQQLDELANEMERSRSSLSIDREYASLMSIREAEHLAVGR